jgi:acetyl esterase/lipase
MTADAPAKRSHPGGDRAGRSGRRRNDDTGPVAAPDASVFAYGEHPSQFAELHLPTEGDGPWPVAILLHGGFWRTPWALDLMRPLAADLTRRGIAAWNVEYRRVGDGGGWPATFLDVAAGVDLLATAAAAAGYPLRLDRTVAVGHSAGGHLALWAAARPRLPGDAPGADPAVRVTAAVSLAGVADLADAARRNLGHGAVVALLGGGPTDDVDGRYRLASPAALLPLGVTQIVVHGGRDRDVPIAHSREYARAARRAGDPVEVLESARAGHYTVIDPESSIWRRAAARLGEAVAGPEDG